MTTQIKVIDALSKEEPGTKTTGSMKVGGTAASPIDLPIITVNGLKEGPTLCLIAGIHGCEYSGIETVIRLTGELDPEKLCGRVVAVPVANKPAFTSRVPYVCPIDGINLNRIFPGNPTGSISYRLAHVLFNNVILKSNFLIDIHGADLPEELPPRGLVILQEKGNEETRRISENLANFFDSEYVLVSEIDGTCVGESCKVGIPALAPEADGAGRIEENAVLFYKNGILNVMKHLGMIKGVPQKSRSKKRIYRLHAVRAEQGGLFYPKCRAGEIVSKGDRVGEVRNLYGHVEERVLAPIHGLVTIRMTNLTVNSGDVVLFLGELEAK